MVDTCSPCFMAEPYCHAGMSRIQLKYHSCFTVNSSLSIGAEHTVTKFTCQYKNVLFRSCERARLRVRKTKVESNLNFVSFIPIPSLAVAASQLTLNRINVTVININDLRPFNLFIKIRSRGTSFALLSSQTGFNTFRISLSNYF